MHKKCDRTLPSCERCIFKGIPCIYTEKQKRGKLRKFSLDNQVVKEKIEKPHKMKRLIEKEPDQPPTDNLYLLSSIVG
jgi:hypothetical protein